MTQDPSYQRFFDPGYGGDFCKGGFILAVRKTCGKIKSVDGLKTDQKVVLINSYSISFPILLQKTYRRCGSSIFQDWAEFGAARTEGVVKMPTGPSISE